MAESLSLLIESLELDLIQMARHKGTEELNRLAASIGIHGVLQPIGVMPGDTKPWKVVFGTGRTLASVIAGLKEIPAVVLDKKTLKSGAGVITLVENMVRTDLKPIQRVDGVEELAQLHTDWSNHEIATQIGLDASSVTRLRAVAHCPIARAALADGRLKGISDAYTVALAPQEQKEGLIHLKISGNLNRNEFEVAARKARKPTVSEGKKAVTATKVKCLLPSGYTVTVSGGSLTLSEAAEALGEAIKEMKHSHSLGYTIKTFAAAMADKARKA
jgi:ParB family chromosome partitioning protein